MNRMTDLQMHSSTTGSDGDLSVEELVKHIPRLRRRRQKVIWSLTDHNTVDGLAEAQELSKKKKMRFIPGCEIMVYDERFGNFEILGYGPLEKMQTASLAEVLQNIRQGLEARVMEQARRWHEKGVEIGRVAARLTDAEYERIIGNPNNFNDWNAFGKVFMAKLEEVLGELPPILEINRRFYDSFREPEGELYIPYSNEFPRPEVIIALFNSVGIVSSLSHPGEYHLDEDARDRLVDALVEMGITGLEVFSRKNTDEQILRYHGLCRDKGLLITGGSDFHSITEQYRLGEYRLGLKIPFAAGEELYERTH